MLIEIENPDGDGNMEMGIDDPDTPVAVCKHNGIVYHPARPMTYGDLSQGDVIEYPSAGGPCREVMGVTP